MCKPKLTVLAEFQLSLVRVKTKTMIVVRRMTKKYLDTFLGVQTIVLRKNGKRILVGRVCFV